MPNGPNDNLYESTEDPHASYASVSRVADVERWHDNEDHTGIPGVGAGGGGLPDGWTQDENDLVDAGGLGITNMGQSDTGNSNLNLGSGALESSGGITLSEDAPISGAGSIGVGAGGISLVDGGIDFTGTGGISMDGGNINVGGGQITNFEVLTPDNPPEVPAIATAQSIVDALVTLGLITQAAP